MIHNDLNLILPEIVLSIFAMLILLIGVYRGQDKKTAILTFSTAGLMFVLGIWMIIDTSLSETAFNNMFISLEIEHVCKMKIIYKKKK